MNLCYDMIPKVIAYFHEDSWEWSLQVPAVGPLTSDVMKSFEPTKRSLALTSSQRRTKQWRWHRVQLCQANMFEGRSVGHRAVTVSKGQTSAFKHVFWLSGSFLRNHSSLTIKKKHIYINHQALSSITRSHQWTTTTNHHFYLLTVIDHH